MTASTEATPQNGLSAYLRGAISADEFVRRDLISNVTILTTLQCPAACAHCLFQSNSKRTERLDPRLARTYIDAASRQSPPPGLGFSGGEPFLRTKLMNELAAYAFERGMPSEVISSGVWCKSPAFARQTLAELQRHGLRTYCTSVDRYHLAFVPATAVRTGILAALDLGLKVVINTMVDAGHIGRESDWISALLDIPTGTMQSCLINPIYTVPVGRAQTQVTDYIFRKNNYFEGCPFSTEVATLTPTGDLYPCCGMVLGASSKDRYFFIHDNIRGKTVEEVALLLKTMKQDLFFRLIQLLGPYWFLHEIQRRNPGLKTRKRFIGSCDICLELVTNRHIARNIPPLLAEIAERGQAECAC